MTDMTKERIISVAGWQKRKMIAPHYYVLFIFSFEFFFF